jgi:sortase A
MRERPVQPHVRRRVSALLIAVGALLLIGSGASVARAALARDAARTRWAELEAQRAATGARAMMVGGAGWAAAPGSPVARLVVPRLGVDEVVVEGVGDDALRAGPGHMTGSALPGQAGNSVISAHRDRHFRPLSGLVVGDTVITESVTGSVRWVVSRIRVVTADAPALRTAETPVLTLTTCWPIGYFGSAPDRLIAEAVPTP